MQRSFPLFAFPAAALLVAFAGAHADPSPADGGWAEAFRTAMSEEEFTACGLDKLEPEELERLFDRFWGAPGRSYLGDAAFARLENDGWRPVHITGGVRSGPFEGDGFLFLAEGYGITVLDPFGTATLLPPGEYWGRNVVSSWTLLDANGREMRYTATNR